MELRFTVTTPDATGPFSFEVPRPHLHLLVDKEWMIILDTRSVVGSVIQKLGLHFVLGRYQLRVGWTAVTHWAKPNTPLLPIPFCFPTLDALLYSLLVKPRPQSHPSSLGPRTRVFPLQ